MAALIEELEKYRSKQIKSRKKLRAAKRRSIRREYKVHFAVEFDSRAAEKLEYICERLNLTSVVDALEISTKITALLLDEIKQGNAVTVKDKLAMISESNN